MGNYIDRIINGEMQAFDDLYLKYKNPVTTILQSKFSKLRNEIPDYYQSACLTVLEYCESGKLKPGDLPDRNIKAYLIRIASNTILSGLRKGGKNRAVFLPLDDPKQTAYCQKGVEKASDDEEDPDYEEKIEIIRQAVDEMPDPCGKLLRMRHREKRSSEEIAKVMDYANGDVAKNMVSRCMRKLKAFVIERFENMGLCV